MSTSRDVSSACPRCRAATHPQTSWCLACGASLLPPLPPPSSNPLEVPLPVVRPHDWPGRAQAVHRSVCWLPDLPYTPWLAFYYQIENRLHFAGPERLQRLGQTLDEFQVHAIASLARAPASWRRTRLIGRSGASVRALVCADQPHACERFLDLPFMVHAHAMLGSEGLAIAFPVREVLIATALDDYPALLDTAADLYQERESPAVTPMVFTVHGAVISGRAVIEDGRPGLYMLARSPVT